MTYDFLKPILMIFIMSCIIFISTIGALIFEKYGFVGFIAWVSFFPMVGSGIILFDCLLTKEE